MFNEHKYKYFSSYINLLNSGNNKILSIIIFILYSSLTYSQIINQDTLILNDSTLAKSFPLGLLNNDTLKTSDTLTYRISKDAVTEEINYKATDSIFSDIANKKMHLYGDAQVEYGTVKLNADYIVVDFENDYLEAYYTRDSSYVPKTKPTFVDGETKAGFREMKYNFKTKKALVKNITTAEAEFFLLGEVAKYVSKENDTILNEDKFFNRRAIITTCNHPTPHFGIRANKLKFIPDKIAVLGPSQIEIMGIPTPLVLPFGFFPLVKGQSSGIIFPDDYQYNPQLGFGLQGIGYYFPINDNIDARVTGDIWSRGTYSLLLNTNYKKRYRYEGGMNLNFTNNVQEDAEAKPITNTSFGINLRHTQDSKAHPYRTIGGSINIQTNRNQQRTNYDYNSVFSNTLSSNFNFNYRWPESPFSFTSSFQHSQNNQTRKVSLTLPSAALNMNTIQPFKRKNATGDLRWYENVSLSYKAQLKNYVETTDTTLFTKATLENLQTGLNHGSNISTNFRVLKYFNVSPSMNYDETYFVKTLEKYFDPTPVLDTVIIGQTANGLDSLEVRTLKNGTVNQRLINDLSVFRRFSASLSVNTQLFKTFRFSKGWLRGLRHTLKPSLSFTYTPETESRYRKYVDTDSNPLLNMPQAYNPFQTGPFPQSYSGKQMSLGYSFNNVIEAKYRRKNDTLDKKLAIFPNINVNGNYNFAADSFNWSNVNVSGNTSIMKGLSNFQFNMIFTPYEINYRTKRMVNKLLIKNGGGLLQLANFNAGFNTGLTFKQITDYFKGSSSSTDTRSESDRNKKVGEKEPHLRSFSALFENLRFSHNITFSTIKTVSGKDSLFIGTNSILISGSIPLSNKWSFNIGSIAYDFKNKSFVYPSFAFRRDLHCWDMSFAWYPQSGVYSFFIGVKASSLNFLKYNYGQPLVPSY